MKRQVTNWKDTFSNYNTFSNYTEKRIKCFIYCGKSLVYDSSDIFTILETTRHFLICMSLAVSALLFSESNLVVNLEHDGNVFYDHA